MRYLRVTLTLMLMLAAGALAAQGPVLKDLQGKPRPVQSYLGGGKWTVVAVWSADCPICRREIHHMTFFHDEHSNKDARVVGISIDGYANKKKAAAFIEEHGLNFPNLIGTPDDAAALGNAPFIGTPTYYFFTPSGELAARRVGPVTQAQAEDLIGRLKAERTQKKRKS